MTVIIGGIFENYVQISADRRRSIFNGKEFSHSIEEWANKIIQLSDHIVLAALGDVEATVKSKKETDAGVSTKSKYKFRRVG